MQWCCKVGLSFFRLLGLVLRVGKKQLFYFFSVGFFERWQKINVLFVRWRFKFKCSILERFSHYAQLVI
jgi:hypothetical protein